MNPFRRAAVPVDVEAGERVLAWADGATGPVAGTREALYLPGGHRVPWEQVESADWDLETTTLTVSEVGNWGVARPVHALVLDEPARLLQLVRERVTATVVLQRHVAVHDKAGVRVIARRAPTGTRELTWLFEYDAGIDPEDPLVVQAAQETLTAARDEVGERSP